MGKVRIVTDSSAHFINPDVIDRYQIQVVPLNIHIGSRTFREGSELDAEAFFRLASHSSTTIAISAPAVEQFAGVYERLNRRTDQILSLHMSRNMSKTWDHAFAASRTLLGRCEIAVIDSLTTSVGLAMLVEAAAEAAEQFDTLEDVVRVVRAMLPRVYTVMFVETLEYLHRNGLLSEAQSILGTMLDIKPFLTIEEGELIPMEKVRTQAQAIDKLVEFVAEFSEPEKLVILQNTQYATDRTRQLQDRLAAEFPGQAFPTMMYGPSLASLIGPDGMGVVVYEKLDDEEDL